MIERSRVRIPAGAAGEFSSPWSTFCADSYFGIRSTPVLPQKHVKQKTKTKTVILPKVQVAGYSCIVNNYSNKRVLDQAKARRRFRPWLWCSDVVSFILSAVQTQIIAPFSPRLSKGAVEATGVCKHISQWSSEHWREKPFY